MQKTIYGTNAVTNSIGQIAEIQAQDGKTQFAYDFKGNILTLQKRFTTEFAAMPDWNNTILLGELFTTETACDALNRLVSVKHPDNSVVSYRYDKGGLLQKVLHGSTEHVTNITYNPKGQRENIYYGNNTKTRYYYNPLNFRLHRLLTTRNTGEVALQDLNYRYDAAGNIVLIRDDAQQTVYFSNSVIAPVSTFEYDALYRLVKATGRELSSLTAPTNTDFANTLACPNTAANAMRNYTHNFGYDQLGNIQSDAWKSYVYDATTNRLLRHTGTTNVYTYDTHGNMTKMPNVSNMVWDYKDQLISAANGSTFTSYFSYDAEGNRTRKVTVKGSVREERYYIGGYEVYRKYTGAATLPDIERKTVNISDDEKVFVRIETQTGGTPAIRYQYDNHLGSACLELDTAGLIISYEEYHPFGTTSYRAGKSSTEVSLKRYKYCGKERDEETGLYYYGARYYAAWLCRFVSCDPLQGDYSHLSPYAYCANNPVRFIDPTGMAWRPTYDEDHDGNRTYNGYEWVDEDKSYNKDGTLKSGLYAQAIFFSDNGTFDADSRYNMGSSTATVYLADGTTQAFDANTNPSSSDYATVPEGVYHATVGSHKGQYTALRMSDTNNSGQIELGTPNPAHPERTYAEGVNIHKPGDNNLTGLTRSGNAVSAGCLLIDGSKWSGFIGSFNNSAQKGNAVSVTVSRTFASPVNANRLPAFNFILNGKRSDFFGRKL